MRADNLQEVIRGEPFRPFALVVADGSKVYVPHPEWIAHPSGARTAVVMGQDESVRIIDVAASNHDRARSASSGWISRQQPQRRGVRSSA